MSDYERQEIRKALLKYCELDTLAMVMIYEGLKDFVEPFALKCLNSILINSWGLDTLETNVTVPIKERAERITL